MSKISKTNSGTVHSLDGGNETTIKFDERSRRQTQAPQTLATRLLRVAPGHHDRAAAPRGLSSRPSRSSLYSGPGPFPRSERPTGSLV